MSTPSDPNDRVEDARPVLVGVGTAYGSDPAPDSHATSEPIDLMVAAARDALRDTGLRDTGPGGSDPDGLVASIGSVAVPVGNWSYPDPARLVAERLGADGASTVRVEIGVSQQTPLRVAAERIRAGELDAALVVGGEARATQQRIARAGGVAPETAQPGVEPDQRWAPEGEFMAQAEIDAGIWEPVEQYACIEAAIAAHEGDGQAAHLDRVAALWERFNVVARTNPDAAFAEPRDASFLRSPGPGNRPLAHPYAKWHSTQWNVDQAAALLLCSAGTARRLGIPSDRWVQPRVLVESSAAVSLTRRAEMHRWPAMEVLGRAAAEHVGTDLAEIDVVELYSCFPSAVQVQQRELGLDPRGTPTVTGGMAFAGGPFNNFSYQATAAVVRRLRDRPGELGLVTTVSGLLTKAALAVWSTDPGPVGEPAGSPLLADLAAEALAATATLEVTSDATGPATVASCTATFSDGEPSSGFVIADLPDGRRWIGTTTSPELLRRIVGGDAIGGAVEVDGTTCAPG